jgi:hypothetical protein
MIYLGGNILLFQVNRHTDLYKILEWLIVFICFYFYNLLSFRMGPF